MAQVPFRSSRFMEAPLPVDPAFVTYDSDRFGVGFNEIMPEARSLARRSDVTNKSARMHASGAFCETTLASERL